MDALTWNLLVAAAGVGLIHTLLGPDHYLPFVMLARARCWSLRRTLVITAVCGVGHVGSSLLLGGVGLALGSAIHHVESLETRRGSLAAWGLVAFGAAYMLWGVRKALRARRGYRLHEHHGHVHLHALGAQPHAHGPQAGHVLLGHSHDVAPDATFWTLFAIFVLGPCEPLIPLFVLPASEGRWGAAAATAVVFSIVTLVAMVAVTGLLVAGVARLPLGPLTRWSHALAGGVIAASGLAVIVLGL
jgi:hypothetical protein